MEYKYLKPRSLTWWVSFAQILMGIFIASAQVHGLIDLAEAFDIMTGSLGPYVLISAGLTGIGLRGAV